MGLLSWFLSRTTTPEIEPIMLARGRGFTLDVVGESNYQPALDRICGGKCEDGHRREVTAQLCFVEDNEWDENAVGVFINKQLVGFVPRDQAAKVREGILAINQDDRPVLCRGKIVGGWNRGHGDEGSYGVKLSIGTPIRPA